MAMLVYDKNELVPFILLLNASKKFFVATPKILLHSTFVLEVGIYLTHIFKCFVFII